MAQDNLLTSSLEIMEFGPGKYTCVRNSRIEKDINSFSHLVSNLKRNEEVNIVDVVMHEPYLRGKLEDGSYTTIHKIQRRGVFLSSMDRFSHGMSFGPGKYETIKTAVIQETVERDSKKIGKIEKHAMAKIEKMASVDGLLRGQLDNGTWTTLHEIHAGMPILKQLTSYNDDEKKRARQVTGKLDIIIPADASKGELEKSKKKNKKKTKRVLAHTIEYQTVLDRTREETFAQTNNINEFLANVKVATSLDVSIAGSVSEVTRLQQYKNLLKPKKGKYFHKTPVRRQNLVSDIFNLIYEMPGGRLKNELKICTPNGPIEEQLQLSSPIEKKLEKSIFIFQIKFCRESLEPELFIPEKKITATVQNLLEELKNGNQPSDAVIAAVIAKEERKRKELEEKAKVEKERKEQEEKERLLEEKEENEKRLNEEKVEKERKEKEAEKTTEDGTPVAEDATPVADDATTV